ncbi:aldehyde dehydrogenase (NADP(+)) [Nocardioides sp. AN3]
MMLESFDPRSGASNGTVPSSTLEEVDAVVRRAAAAAAAVAAASPDERRHWLCAVADALEANAAELADLADSETGLGLPRLTGEVARAAGQLRFYGDVAAEGSYLRAALDHATETTPALGRVSQPLGPVAVFGASNFPFAFSVLGNDTGSAIAAGCPVVVKGHPAHPLLSVRLAELARAALAGCGAPEGVFGFVAGHEAGVALVEHPDVAAVAFTGSQAGGLALWRIANAREVVIPVYAEMGTVNPVIVTPAALASLEQIATGFVGSFTLGSGQFCTKPGLLLAPAGSGAARGVADALRAASPAPHMLTAPIAASVRAGLAELCGAGARIVGEVEGPAEGWSAPAVVLEAPVSALTAGSRLTEECFGPVALVVEYDGREELAHAVAQLQGSLAGSVMTGSADADPDADPDAAYAVELLAAKVGRVAVNDWPTGVAYTWAQQHGGPWPSTSVPAATSVGAAALDRFTRPVTYQSAADVWLPPALQSDNPWRVPRRVDGVLQAPTQHTAQAEVSA